MIGVFDSGLGGLTVVKELMRALPGKGIVYFGDTARMPYGTKGPEVVKRFAVEDARFLISKGAKAIIVACNTASALAFDEVRRAVRVPVFEVVTPASERAARLTRGSIGVIGTPATVRSGIYARKMASLSPKSRVHAAACPLFVPLVEEGWSDKPETVSIARAYLRPLKEEGIDTLILGCTHYPFLKPAIRKVIGRQVEIVDPARETVAAFMRYLDAHPGLAGKFGRAKDSRFYASDRTAHFADIASRWLGRKIVLEKADLG